MQTSVSIVPSGQGDTNEKLDSTALISMPAASAFAGGSVIAATPGSGEPTLAEVRAATERFQDVKVALAEGYIRDPADMCDKRRT